MKTKATMGGLVAAAVFAAGAVAAEDVAALTGEAISALVKGKRVAGQKGGASLRMRFSDDGNVSIQEGHAVLTGKWSVAGDTLCLKIPAWSYDGCGKVRASGTGNTVEKSDGAELLALAR